MMDTTNILLECDLRQAEVALLVKILQEDPKLLVKLVKASIVKEVADAGIIALFSSLIVLYMSLFT
jgi:hypothetical protein